jgi:hypothetical protein
MHRILYITNHSIDPGKRLQRDTGRSATRHYTLMLAPGFFHSTETGESIGYNETPRCQMSLYPLRDCLLAKTWNLSEAHRDRMALFIGLNSSHKWCLARRSAPAFATALFTTPIRIIHLYDAK